jgi:phosphatidylinositol alpha-1,6-mannosyltransferase
MMRGSSRGLATERRSAVRVLAVTPDFPPAPGGIQVLCHRLVHHAELLRTRVVTLPASVGVLESPDRLDVRRVGWAPGDRRLAVSLLNLKGVWEGLRFRPEVALSFHIVTAPAAWILKRALRIPVVLYLYGDELRARPKLTRFAVRRADAVVVISRHTEDMAMRLGADRAKIHLIPPGVDLSERRLDKRSERPTVVTVARLEDRYKGHDIVMRALPFIRRRVPDVRWVVVGDGSLRPELERLAATCGVDDAVLFTGRVTDEERDRWLDRAQVFVMPSRLPEPGRGGEGFGIVFMEASVHGLPVVAGSVGGALDAVVDGQTGLLVDPTSPEAVANAVCGLLLDPKRAAAIGQAGAAHARQFAWPRIAARLETLVLDLTRPEIQRTGSSRPDASRTTTRA